MATAQQWDAFRRRLIAALTIIGAVWGLFACVSQMLPYVRPGAALVHAAKSEVVRTGTLFRREAAVRIAVFGNSKVLSGFKPDRFDRLSSGRVSSYNLGLPSQALLIEHLSALCQRGEAPTHVFTSSPWSQAPAKPRSIFKSDIDDAAIMDQLFPFRRFPRDVVLFALGARSGGGLSAWYQHGKLRVQSMLSDRGYYFIEGQSHFPNHRLPDDFALQNDHPERTYRRKVSVDVPAFGQLIALLELCDVQVLLIPPYFRDGEYAPPHSNSDALQSLARYPRLAVLAPAYWLLPNRYFSDPVHLNPDGAELYTRMLWELTQPVLFPRRQDTGDTAPVSSLLATP